MPAALNVIANPPPNNLPATLSSFIGRAREMDEVQRLFASNRLVTLTGPGGCGKTRLALQTATGLMAEMPDGVWLIEFASLADPDLVPQAVASALGLREQPGRPLLETLANFARPRQLLLVLDNCEHLVAACADLAQALLRACPALRLLATSREPLGVPGEATWPVPPLSLPEPRPWRSPASGQATFATYQQSEAIRLFVARAMAVSPDFSLTGQNAPVVADICRRLDGMPLAIELAAARVRALSVEQIAERLDDRFRLLTGGSRTAPPRQQTLAATLDWSYALLPHAEQIALQRLSVFVGGWTLTAAEAVCAGDDLAARDVLDVLTRLVDKSLVQTDPGDGETRYRLLETIRQYAQQHLADSGEAALWRDRHLDYFITWAEAAEPQLGQPDKVAWLSRFETEHDNLRAALTWASTSADRANQSLRLVALSGRFWHLHGYHTEGRARLSAALGQAGAEKPENAPIRVGALARAAVLAFLQSDYPATRELCQASLAICPELGEAGRPRRAEALDRLADVETEQGNYSTARPLFEEALAIYRQLGQNSGVGHTLTMLGWLDMRAGDYEHAATQLEAALAHCRALGDPELIAQALAGRGELAVRQGQYALAATLLQESLALRRQLGESWGIAITLGTLAWLALLQRDYTRMRTLLAESLAIRQDSGDAGGSAWCLERLAEAALFQGQAAPPVSRAGFFARAARIFGAAAALRSRLNAVMDHVDQPEFERHLALLRAGLGDEAFSAAWAEGSALALPQATDYALAGPEPAAAGELPPTGTPAAQDFGGLTARERQVASLIAQGRSNRQIAETMVLSLRTVETYVTRILSKLGLASRVQIATWAIEKGLSPSTR